MPVERSLTVTVDARTRRAETFGWFDGLTARVVQHEIDHLDGRLILDRTDDESRREALGILRPQPVLQ